MVCIFLCNEVIFHIAKVSINLFIYLLFIKLTIPAVVLSNRITTVFVTCQIVSHF